jgi:hypothetical protein
MNREQLIQKLVNRKMRSKRNIKAICLCSTIGCICMARSVKKTPSRQPVQENHQS